MKRRLWAVTAILAVVAVSSPQSAWADRLFATHFSIWGESWITEFDPQTGAELNRFAPPVALNQDSGLAYDGLNLYFLSGLSQYNDIIYKLDANSGTVVGQYDLPANSYRSGLAVIGQSLYVSDWHPNHNGVEVYDLVTGAHERTMGFVDYDDQGRRLMIDRGLGAIRGPDALLATVHPIGMAIPCEILELSPLTGEILDRFYIADDDADNGAQGLTSIGSEVFLGLHVQESWNQIIVYDRDGVEQRRFGIFGSTGVQALAGGPELSQIPEPSAAVALAGLGAILLARAGWRRRRKRSQRQ
jgi:hypothetical protein